MVNNPSELIKTLNRNEIKIAEFGEPSNNQNRIQTNRNVLKSYFVYSHDDEKHYGNNSIARCGESLLISVANHDHEYHEWNNRAKVVSSNKAETMRKKILSFNSEEFVEVRIINNVDDIDLINKAKSEKRVSLKFPTERNKQHENNLLLSNLIGQDTKSQNCKKKSSFGSQKLENEFQVIIGQKVTFKNEKIEMESMQSCQRNPNNRTINDPTENEFELRNSTENSSKQLSTNPKFNNFEAKLDHKQINKNTFMNSFNIENDATNSLCEKISSTLIIKAESPKHSNERISFKKKRNTEDEK